MSAGRDRPGRVHRGAFTAMLLGLVAMLAYLTWPVPSASYLLPACILAPTGVLLTMQLAKDLRARRARHANNTSPVILGAVTWMLLMPVLFALFGLVIAAALYTSLYLRWRSGESLRLAGVAGVVVGAALSVLAWSLNKPQLLAAPLW